MNSKDLIKFFEVLMNEKTSVIVKKNHDYANNTNCFSNFEFVAKSLNIKVELVFLVLILIKIARIEELINSNKTTSNESLSDSLLDLSNYVDLLNLYISQTEYQKKEYEYC